MVNHCTDGHYDIIFMDIQMPRINGYDAELFEALIAATANRFRLLP